jgi:hypothetical protein
MVWVADKAGAQLVAQIDAIAPGRSRVSDGTIGDPAHAARVSAHNPEDSGDADAPGNPDNQVDAFDVTHDPGDGCDIGVFWEQIRASRDMRARFAIFNSRCFSNYAVSGYAAFTWRPYSGENDHSRHGHIEIDDRYHDQVHPWQIGPTMFLAACKVGDSGPHVAFLQYALWALHEETKADGAAPLWPLKDNVPQIPAKMDAVTGAAMRRLLDGGDGIHFTPLLATRLIRKLGKVDVELIPGPPGAGVSADEAREIARDEISGATATLTPSARV